MGEADAGSSLLVGVCAFQAKRGEVTVCLRDCSVFSSVPCERVSAEPTGAQAAPITALTHQKHLLHGHFAALCLFSLEVMCPSAVRRFKLLTTNGLGRALHTCERMQ